MAAPTLAELTKGYKETYPPAIADILDQQFDLRNQWLGPDIRPLAPDMRVAGPAFTIRWVNDPSPATAEYRKMVAEMMDALGEFMVPTIDSSRCHNTGYWGELMCTFCRERGIDGAVIDGGVRDAYYILKDGFNLFASFSCPLEANTRSRIESYQKPIYINDVLIRPGDFVVGDLGGLMVVPKEIVVQVYYSVLELQARESETRRMIRAGAGVDEITVGGTKSL
jgi:regulator of RNase E activity RraA